MNSITEELAQTELFKGVSDAILAHVAEQASPFELVTGEVLLTPEINNECVYLLLSGKLALHFGSLDSPEIHELGKGVSVGEISIIDGMPPSAYVIAKEPCRVFPVQRQLIHSLIAETCPIADNLLKLLSHYMRENTSRIIKDRAEIWELSDHVNVDALTRLYNRRWLENTFIRLLEQSVKCEHPLPLCVLLIDVDNFKHYNDTLGHSCGDQALISLGEVLRSSIRIYDYAVRYGGEEFLVILPNTNRAEGIATAERIRKNAAKKTIITPEGARLPSITISIGLAMNKANSTPKTMIDDADAQLYRAKESGRNCIRYEEK